MDSQHPIRGSLAMLAAVLAFSLMDVTMKHLVATYPSLQVTFLRGAASLPFLIAASLLWGRWRDLLPVRWSLHVVRGLLSVATLCAFIYAVSLLSLADTYAIFMSAPLLITALSVPMLREHVGWQRWLAVLIGLFGVLVVLKPGSSDLITLGGLAAFASALGYALSALTIRVLSRTDPGPAIILWAILLMSVVSGLLAIPAWKPLQSEHVWWIVALGLSGALGQYFITYAFSSARLGAIASLEYTALVWGMLFDWLFWRTSPNARMLVGAAIIVASGLYVIHREARGRVLTSAPASSPS